MQKTNKNTEQFISKAAKLRELVKAVQFRTDKTLEEIGADIGRTQGAISMAMAGKHDPDNMYNRIKEKYAAQLGEQKPVSSCQEAAALARVTLRAVAEVLANQRGLPVQEVIESLERQANSIAQAK